MNVDRLYALADAGELRSLDEYRRRLNNRTGRDDLGAQIELRHAERCVMLAVARARELGKLAKRGSHGENGPPTMEQLGVNWRDQRSFHSIGPDQMGDEEFALALDLATRERNASRANVVRMAGRPVRSQTDDRHQLLAHRRRIVPERVITQSVDTLRGVAEGIELLLPEDYDALDPLSVQEWSREIAEAKRSINKMHKELSSRA